MTVGQKPLKSLRTVSLKPKTVILQDTQLYKLIAWEHEMDL